jgi:aspartyl-tRNA synthetase
MKWKRTHTLGEIGPDLIGSELALGGWVQTRRDLGKLIFCDLRDRWGFLQAVFDPALSADAHRVAESVRPEYVLLVKGVLNRRPAGTENLKIANGGLEVRVSDVEVLSRAETPPFYIQDEVDVDELLRMEYRYLDIRRRPMTRNLTFRHKVVLDMRNFLSERGFIEVETPILGKGTPEGARDYLVPSRISKGMFYALPQSPQLMKQVLMIAGIDRYFQIAKCLRDEDLRVNRQPEHTQLDLEMSFAGRDDLFELTESLMEYLFERNLGAKIEKPFPIITYAEAMATYGIDKPDLRYGLEIQDVTGILGATEFGPFKEAQEFGGIHAIFMPGVFFSRKESDELAGEYKQAGTAVFFVEVKEGAVRSSLAKYFSEETKSQISKAADGGGTFLIMAAGTRDVLPAMGRLRSEMARRFGMIPAGVWKFAWIVDFPLFEVDKDTGLIGPSHHAFTMPKEEDIPFLDTEPLKARAEHYDLVLNGEELFSGSLRITRPELQSKVFDIMGLTKEQQEERFGFLLKAYRYGAPPHLGFGLGLDRLLMSMLGVDSIRDVIAFPKTTSAFDPLTKSPSGVEPEQLRDLGIKPE